MIEFRQLPLPFTHQPGYHEIDFLMGAANAAAMTWLARTDIWPQRRLALSGPPGSGKTHMLHIWAARCGATRLAGHALRFRPVSAPLAIDDADTAPEVALLHTLNAAGEAGWPVLLTARTPPSRWHTALPDLASRLRAITATSIAAPDDELLRLLFVRLLAERQLPLAEPVQAWLRLRLPRTADALREAACRLDRLCAIAHRPPSRVLAAMVLSDMATVAERDGLDELGDIDDTSLGHEDFTQSPPAGSAALPGLL